MVDSSGFEVNCLDYGFSPHFAWCVDTASIGTDRQTQIQGRWTDGGAPTSTLSSNGSGRAPGTQNPCRGFPSEETACSLALDWAANGSSRTQSGSESTLWCIHTCVVQNQPSHLYTPVWFRTNPASSYTPVRFRTSPQVHTYLHALKDDAGLLPLCGERALPVAKVMRKEAWHTQRQDQASGVSLEILEHVPPKPESAYFLLCAFTYTSSSFSFVFTFLLPFLPCRERAPPWKRS